MVDTNLTINEPHLVDILWIGLVVLGVLISIYIILLLFNKKKDKN